VLHWWELGHGRAAVELNHLGTADKGVRDHDGHVAALALVPSRDGHGACLDWVVDDHVVIVVLGVRAIVGGRESLFTRHVPVLEHDALLPGRWARLLRSSRVEADVAQDGTRCGAV
jgi:hypothetical protein